MGRLGVNQPSYISRRWKIRIKTSRSLQQTLHRDRLNWDYESLSLQMRCIYWHTLVPKTYPAWTFSEAERVDENTEIGGSYLTWTCLLTEHRHSVIGFKRAYKLFKKYRLRIRYCLIIMERALPNKSCTWWTLTFIATAISQMVNTWVFWKIVQNVTSIFSPSFDICTTFLKKKRPKEQLRNKCRSIVRNKVISNLPVKSRWVLQICSVRDHLYITSALDWVGGFRRVQKCADVMDALLWIPQILQTVPFFVGRASWLI